jgi:hypothetical protein
MKRLRRFVIIVAAMIAGGTLAAKIVDWYYGWDVLVATATLVFVVPAAALFSATIADILTGDGTRRRHFPL